MDTTALIALLVFIIPMCFTPGPNNMLCAAHGAQHGFRATIPLTLGMLAGWSVLGIIVGVAIATIEANQFVFNALTYIGATYIAYLGITIARMEPKPLDETDETERLGFATGALLQFVNGKAWIHFLALMATWGGLFGSGIMSKIALVALNAFAGYPAVLVWAGFGVGLRKAFSSPQNAKRLNIGLGLSLVLLAVWIFQSI
ncbi:MAG TPA: LysE family translocator [Candidatus Poseidoniaceae archaeon]|jgi:threonine/homoserine/homoserine lactone efflux protein|nr:MAG TPA: LysE family translocator [Candidatus Poseidoniales archaeon]HII11244.1 LysE family translocator [Candidatus Poseidoniaceae archaeon]|tara:strand:- start:284 stop:886 length:603 start_codon:yes stop_codon:yes gene_type:complete